MIIDEENNNIFIVEKLNSLKNELNRDQVNLKSVQRDIKQLENYDNTANYEYLNSLLDPIKTKGVKVPSKCPIPSCTFQLHNYLTFHPGENGFDVFTMNPFFLASEKVLEQNVNFGSATYKLVSGAGMYFFGYLGNPIPDGSSPIETWYFPDNPFVMIPDVYAKYRLVSACCTLKYLGQLDEAKGVVGCGINYLKTNYVGTRVLSRPQINERTGSRNPDLADFGNIELIRDSYYHSENLCLEGLKMLYFPLDNSFEEFKNVWDGSYLEAANLSPSDGFWPAIRISDKYFKPGFNWFIYTQGVPYSEARNFRFDYYLNFECVPKAEFLNYMPITLNVKPCLPDSLKKKFMDEVQDKAIQKINIY